MTQQDGPNPPDGPPDAGNQRKRRWPAVADVDWWRDEAPEYVPAPRLPAEPPRDPEIDFDLDDPGAPPPAAATTEIVPPGVVDSGVVDSGVVDSGVVASDVVENGVLASGVVEDGAVEDGVLARDVVATEIVETRSADTGLVGAEVVGAEVVDAGPVADAGVVLGAGVVGDAGVVDAEVVEADERPASRSPATSPWAARTARPAPTKRARPVGTVGPPVDRPVDAPVDEAVETAVDEAVDTTADAPQADAPPADAPVADAPVADEPVASTESGGIGRSTSPYARPPRVTRREVAPTPRRVMPIPPAIITAPTSAESLVESVPSDVDSTIIIPPPEAAGPSLFHRTGDGAIPALPRPRRQPAPPPTRRARRVRSDRPGRAWVGLPALLLLLFAAAFVGWVSAEPFWLDAGHGTDGTATVVARTDRCRVIFAAAGGGFTTSTVDLAGADLDRCAVGAALPAQMVSADAARAYVVDRAGLRLRWAVGLGVLLLCGWAIALATGAGRFRGWQRLTAIALSLSAPLAVAATTLALTY